MEFCQAQGFVDGDAVADQRNAIARFPPAPAGSPSTDAAEALGRTGKVWFGADMPAIMQSLGKNGGMLMGPDMATLEQFAESHRVTVRLVCKQAAYNAKLEEEEAHQPPRPNGALPRLPAMPFGLPDARVFTPEDMQELQQLRTTRH